MDVKEFENKRWGAADQKTEFRHRAATSLIEGGTVLDLGCGDGHLFELLSNKIVKKESVGLDISPEAVRKVVAKGFNARVHSFDDPLPFEHSTFDHVVLLDVLEHVYDPTSLLREAARVSKKSVIISVPNFSSLPARLQTLLGRVPENNRPHKGHIYWFNHAVLAGVVRGAGLEVVVMKMNTFFPITHTGNSLVRLFPNLLALSFVAQARVSL